MANTMQYLTTDSEILFNYNDKDMTAEDAVDALGIMMVIDEIDEDLTKHDNDMDIMASLIILWNIARTYINRECESSREQVLMEMKTYADPIGIEVTLLIEPTVHRRISNIFGTEVQKILGFIDGFPIIRYHHYKPIIVPNTVRGAQGDPQLNMI